MKRSARGKPVKSSTALATATRLYIPPIIQESSDVTIKENKPVEALKTGQEVRKKRKR